MLLDQFKRYMDLSTLSPEEIEGAWRAVIAEEGSGEDPTAFATTMAEEATRLVEVLDKTHAFPDMGEPLNTVSIPIAVVTEHLGGPLAAALKCALDPTLPAHLVSAWVHGIAFGIFLARCKAGAEREQFELEKMFRMEGK